jgi:hypothetical protein
MKIKIYLKIKKEKKEGKKKALTRAGPGQPGSAHKNYRRRIINKYLLLKKKGYIFPCVTNWSY